MNKDSIKEYFLGSRNIIDELKKIDRKKLITNICIILSFYVINLFMSRFVKFDFSAKIFNLFWFILIYIIISLVKHKRFYYSLFYFVFFICSIIQYFHINIVQKPFGISQLLYIKEGMTYTNSILSNINIQFVLYLIFGIVNYIVCFKLIKKYLNDNNKQILRNIVLICVFLPILAASRTTFISIFNSRDNNINKFYAQFSYDEIYKNFNDKEVALKMTGIFEYSIREPWLYIKKIVSYDTIEKIKLINDYFENTNISYEKNKYTDIFENKNVIIIMAESIDSWLIDEEIMPTVYKMQQNSLNFINRYAPYYGSGRTLNTEYCLNTGLYIPIDYNIYTAEDNNLKYSLANMFKTNGYYTSSIHFNHGEFYDRINMHKSYGYDNSYFLADMTNKYYYNDADIIKNDKFYNLMINKENKFLTFFTTYSAHLPYNETNTLCEDVNTEEECIKKLARLTDDAIKILLEKLEKDNLIDDTVIVFVTDHYAYGYDNNTVAKIKGGDDNIHLDKVPFFIWNNNKYVKQIDRYMDTQDILPTLLNLFGIKYGNVYIGTDVFDENHNNYVYFSDNSYVGDLKDKSMEDIQNEKNVNEWIIKTNYYTKK